MLMTFVTKIRGTSGHDMRLLLCQHPPKQNSCVSRVPEGVAGGCQDSKLASMICSWIDGRKMLPIRTANLNRDKGYQDTPTQCACDEAGRVVNCSVRDQSEEKRVNVTDRNKSSKQYTAPGLLHQLRARFQAILRTKCENFRQDARVKITQYPNKKYHQRELNMGYTCRANKRSSFIQQSWSVWGVVDAPVLRRGRR